MLAFVRDLGVGLFKAEANDPAVRRAVRVLEAAVVAAAVVFARAHGLPV